MGLGVCDGPFEPSVLPPPPPLPLDKEEVPQSPPNLPRPLENALPNIGKKLLVVVVLPANSGCCCCCAAGVNSALEEGNVLLDEAESAVLPATTTAVSLLSLIHI